MTPNTFQSASLSGPQGGWSGPATEHPFRGPAEHFEGSDGSVAKVHPSHEFHSVDAVEQASPFQSERSEARVVASEGISLTVVEDFVNSSTGRRQWIS